MNKKKGPKSCVFDVEVNSPSAEGQWSDPPVNSIHMTSLHGGFWGWRLSGQEAFDSHGNALPPHSPPETFGDALAFLEQDGGSRRQTAQLRNPPDVSTFQRSGPRYVTAALYTWQGRLVLCCISERTALSTAFIKDSWLEEAERLHLSEVAFRATEQHLKRHIYHAHIFMY